MCCNSAESNYDMSICLDTARRNLTLCEVFCGVMVQGLTHLPYM